MANLQNRRIGVSTFRDQQALERAASEVFTRFKEFSKTKIALNNLFLFDDSIQKEIDSPLFSLRGEFPFPELSTIPYPNGYKSKKLPEKINIETFSIELYETAEARVWQYYDAWHSRIYHNNGTFNLPEGTNGFKKTLSVYRYDSFINRVWGVEYTGVYPVNITPYSPSSDDPNVVTFTVTYSVDDAKWLRADGIESGISKTDPSVVEPHSPDFNEEWQKAKINSLANTAGNAALKTTAGVSQRIATSLFSRNR